MMIGALVFSLLFVNNDDLRHLVIVLLAKCGDQGEDLLSQSAHLIDEDKILLEFAQLLQFFFFLHHLSR